MPLRSFLRAKIHRAEITEANVEYVGSISLDPAMMQLADIAPNEQVDVYNIDNGERLTTYAIEGAPGEICLNGAAAKKGAVGDKIIIAAYTLLEPHEIEGHEPKIVLVGDGNVLTS